MEEITEVGALFNVGVNRPGSPEISPVERLLNEFEAHEVKEEKSLDEYKKLARKFPNSFARFLVQLIVADEEKHRAVIHAMIATLRGSLTWTRPEATFEGSTDRDSTNGRFRLETDSFIELEREGIWHYKILAKESTGYYHGTFKTLLESMIRDSEKHIELLQFLKENLKES